MLRELAQQPLSDATLAAATRALVLSESQVRPENGTPRPPRATAAPASVQPISQPVSPRPPSPVVQPLPVLPEPPPKTAEPGVLRGEGFVRLTIRMDGTRTTACIAVAIHRAACERFGGPSKVSEMVRELYRQAPATAANRSGWVQEQLRAKLAASERDEATADLFGGAQV